MKRKIYSSFLVVAGVFLALSLALAEAIPDASSVTIVWTTDEPSTSQVEYGEDTAGSRVTASDSNLVTSHKIFISGLKPSALYHYCIESRDAAGNEAQSQEFSFVTLAQPDKTPPLISDIEAEGVVAAGPVSAEEPAPNIEAGAGGLVKKEAPIEKVLIERGGLLLSKGKLQIEPTQTYAYVSANRISITGFTVLPVLVIGEISSETVKRHILIETLTTRYGLLDNLQLEFKVPYRYQHERVAVSTSSETVRSLSGIGDVEGGLYSQLGYEHDWVPDIIGGISVKPRTGKSPYGRNIGLGTGHWGVKASFVAVKSSDPAIIFGGLGYTWNIKRNDIKDYGTVDPGDTFSYNLGCAFALNYQLGLNFQLEQLLTPKMVMNGQGVPGSFTNVINLKYGATWSISKNLSCDVSASHGLTTDSPDFVLEVRFPYTF